MKAMALNLIWEAETQSQVTLSTEDLFGMFFFPVIAKEIWV